MAFTDVPETAQFAKPYSINCGLLSPSAHAHGVRECTPHTTHRIGSPTITRSEA
jgi:hypothetical protein